MPYSDRTSGCSCCLPRPVLSLARNFHDRCRLSSGRRFYTALKAYKTLQYNGRKVSYVSKADVAFLYNEIEGKRCYFQHGVALARGDTVVDVGANIGIFAAQAAREVSESGRVIACEPLPSTFAALQHNMQSLLNPGMSLPCLTLAALSILAMMCMEPSRHQK